RRPQQPSLLRRERFCLGPRTPVGLPPGGRAFRVREQVVQGERWQVALRFLHLPLPHQPPSTAGYAVLAPRLVRQRPLHANPQVAVEGARLTRPAAPQRDREGEVGLPREGAPVHPARQPPDPPADGRPRPPHRLVQFLLGEPAPRALMRTTTPSHCRTSAPGVQAAGEPCPVRQRHLEANICLIIDTPFQLWCQQLLSLALPGPGGLAAPGAASATVFSRLAASCSPSAGTRPPGRRGT